MAREIKFRVWDEKKNCWEKTGNFVLYPERPLVQQGYIFQQYTGFWDADGTEIWEGDIVRYSVWDCFVEWNDKWVFRSKETIGFRQLGEWPLGYIVSRTSKVIGNIFENLSEDGKKIKK